MLIFVLQKKNAYQVCHDVLGKQFAGGHTPRFWYTAVIEM